MSQTQQAHKDNAPGPFYVCDGCCTACDLPFAEAPEMFAYDHDNHCYIKRQPEIKDELNSMLRVVNGAELECIRYRGNDPDILRRLAEGGLSQLSDTPISGIRTVSRNHLTFDAADPLDKSLSLQQLVIRFKEYLLSKENKYVSYKFAPLIASPSQASVSYSWFEDNFHSVDFFSADLPERRWHVVNSGVPFYLAVSLHLHDWLSTENRFCNIRWFTESQWNGSRDWQETPL